MDLYLGQLLILLVGLTISAAVAQPGNRPEAMEGEIQAPAAWQHWLDEVRAQRQAWEARRRAAQNARRRQISPQWAAQHEAREREYQQRRQAMWEEMERQRETFWNSIPWAGPYERRTWQDNLPRNPDTDSSNKPAPNPLPGWDNLWYYRGY